MTFCLRDRVHWFDRARNQEKRFNMVSFNSKNSDDDSQDPCNLSEWIISDAQCMTEKEQYAATVRLYEVESPESGLIPFRFGYADIAFPNKDIDDARAIRNDFRMFIIFSQDFPPMRVALVQATIKQSSRSPGCQLRVQFVAIAQGEANKA
jgi:hypothetical protein